MPRKKRLICFNGYMHLILRGVGRQILFEDREDFFFFLSGLKRFSEETEIQVIAYCLMDNHVHLLAQDKNGKTSLFMKKLAISYARYFNIKYDRVGHLFQNRYLNENIKNEKSLLNTFRYILNNPVKAGICPAALYEWSSYSLYDSKHSFVNTSMIHKLIGNFHQMDSFLKEGKDDRCMEDRTFSHNDAWAREIMNKTLNIKNGSVLKEYKKEDRDECLRLLKAEGLSVRQIERLTGISKSVVQRACGTK